MFIQKIFVVLLLLLFVCSPVWAQKQQPSASASPSPESKSPAVEQPAAAPITEAHPADQSNEHLPFMADTARESQEAAPSTGGLMLRTLGALLLIVGLIVAAAWGMKRFGGARFGKAADDAPILSVLNSIALGDKRSVALVRFGDRTLLIGSTAQTITLLGEEINSAPSDLPSVAEMLGETEAIAFADELSVVEIGGRLEQW